jgi:hypothetical protein
MCWQSEGNLHTKFQMTSWQGPSTTTIVADPLSNKDLSAEEYSIRNKYPRSNWNSMTDPGPSICDS